MNVIGHYKAGLNNFERSQLVMRSILAICIVFLCMPFSTVYGMELAGLQGQAVKNRGLVQRYVNNLEKSRKDETIAKSGYYPSVNLSYVVNSLDEASTTEAKENSIFSGNISYNLFAGFQDKYGVRSAALLRQVEEYKLQGIKQDILGKVALYYLSVYGYKANLKAARDTHATLERVYEDGKKRNEVGLIDNNSLLKFKVDLDYAAIQVKTAEAELKKSLLMLQRESGTQLSLDELSFPEFQQLPAIDKLENYEKLMLENRSEIKVMQEMVGLYEAQAKAAQAAYYPQLNLTASYQNYNDDYINGAGDVSVDETRLQLVLSMNLFSGFTTRETIAKLEIDRRSAQLDLEELKNDLKTTLASLYLDYEVNRENVSAALTNIEQAKENLRITRLKYSEGLQTESELLDAVSTLSRAENNHVAVITSLYSNHYQIVRMMEQFHVPGM